MSVAEVRAAGRGRRFGSGRVQRLEEANHKAEGIVLETEKKQLSRLADELDARQREIDIKQDLCEHARGEGKTAEAAMIAREVSAAELEDEVREYKTKSSP